MSEFWWMATAIRTGNLTPMTRATRDSFSANRGTYFLDFFLHDSDHTRACQMLGLSTAVSRAGSDRLLALMTTSTEVVPSLAADSASLTRHAQSHMFDRTFGEVAP